MLNILLNKSTSPYDSNIYLCKVLYSFATFTDLVKLVTVAVLCYCTYRNRHFDKQSMGDRYHNVAFMILIALWIYPILTVILPIATNWGALVHEPVSGLCVISTTSNRRAQLITFLAFTSIFGIGIPITFIVIYCIKVLSFIHRVRYKRPTFVHNQSNNQSDQIHRADTQLGKVTLTIALIEVLLNLPWALIQAMRIIGVNMNISILIYLAIFCSCFSSVLNPLLFYRKETKNKRPSRCNTPDRTKIIHAYTVANRTKIN